MLLQQIKEIKKLRAYFFMFYIEPIVFVLVFAHGLSGTVMKNEILYLTCKNVFNYNDSDCLRLGTENLTTSLQQIETEIQPFVAKLFMIRTVIESIIPAIIGVFVGSWSDHYGRKPLLLISMIGFSFTYVIAIVLSELSRYYPLNPWYYILCVLPHSILGGNCVLSVAALCFISDITDIKTRPYRMMFLEIFLSIGLMTGSFLSSFIYAATNTTVIFVISSIFVAGATIYIAICVPESLRYKIEQINDQNLHPIGDNTKENGANKSVGKDGDVSDISLEKTNSNLSKTEIDSNKLDSNKKTEAEPEVTANHISSLFSFQHIKEMWTTCFKPRPEYDRCIVLLVTGTMFLVIFVWDGVMTVFYLFVREKFQWTIRDFTIYETVYQIKSLFGSIIGFLLLRKVFHLSVVTLAILAFLGDMARNIIQALATKSWHLYLAVVVGLLRSVGGPMCRTIVANIIPPTEIGKIYTIKNILQNLAPFIAAPLYTWIYSTSLHSFAGLFNVLSAFLYFICFVFMTIVLYFKIQHKEYYGKILK